MGVNILHADPAEVIHRFPKTDPFSDGRRAGFKFIRQFIVGGILQVDAFDHISAGKERRH